MKILLCPPKFYEISYEINPWMKISAQPHLAKAQEQWEKLVEALREAGAELFGIEPSPGLPDMCFTANGGLVSGKMAVLSRFQHAERQGEEPLFRAWFQANGFAVKELSQGASFEGEGDCLRHGPHYFAGLGFRSNAQGHAEVARHLGVELHSLRLVDPHYYHLDTCFCPLDETRALYYPPAFAPESQRLLKERVPHLIPVTPGEAARFCCNAVVLGRQVLLNQPGERLTHVLEMEGFQVVGLELDQFLKAGGAAKCLTLFVG